MPKKGYKQTKEHTDKMKKNRKGKGIGNKNAKGIIPWNKGLTGFLPWNKGIKYTEKQKKCLNLDGLKIGRAWNKGTKGICKPNRGSFVSEKMTGENHPNWLGGESIKKYSTEWNKKLRVLIRERDNYICQLCGDKQDKRAFSVHHIDYDKLNCNSNNLITLCVKCHAKTNFNRKEWTEYFINLMKNIWQL